MATGATYRGFLRPLVEALLSSGLARGPLLSGLTMSDRFRNAFYYRLRRATGSRMCSMLGHHRSVEVIGDARSAGKSDAAILDAFRAACGTGTMRAVDPDAVASARS